MKSWQFFVEKTLLLVATVFPLSNQILICGQKQMPSGNNSTAQQKERGAKHQPTPAREPGELDSEKHDNQSRARYHLIVVFNQSSSTNINADQLHFIRYGFLKRLKQAAELSVSEAVTMTRSQAFEQSKKEKQAFIVWLDLENVESINPFINYYIFQPVTGEIKKSEKISLKHDSGAGVEENERPGATVTRNEYVAYGVAAASKVLAALDIRTAPERL